MFNRRFTPYLVVAGLIALVSTCYVGYRVYQEHVKFEAFLSQVQVTLDNDTDTPKQAKMAPRGKDIPLTRRHQVDASSPPIQVGVHSEQAEADFEPIDWSKVSPELRAKMKQLDNAPMKLQRIQTPNGKVHFIELPAGIDYSKVDITVSEDMTKTPTFPPTGSFPEAVSVQKSDIPEGEDVGEHIYKMQWASFLDVSVEEVGRMMERGQLPQRTNVERSTVIEFPIEELIGDGDHFRNGESIGDVQRSGEHRSEATVPAEGSVQDVKASPARPSIPQGVEPVPPGMGELEKRLAPEGVEAELGKSVSPDRLDEMQQLVNQYGPEEGLRRFRELAPEAAPKIEQTSPPKD